MAKKNEYTSRTKEKKKKKRRWKCEDIVNCPFKSPLASLAVDVEVFGHTSYNIDPVGER